MRGENAALGAAGLAGFLVLGEVVPRLGLVEQEYFPPVSRIAEALATEIGDAAFRTALGDTLTGWALGLAIAVAAGIVVGVLLSVVPYLREATASTVEFLRPIGRTAGARLVPRPARRHQEAVVKHGKGGSMLDVRGLRKVYEGSGRRVEAVRDLTFTVEAGELVCLVGPSGCGKTTLLKCMGGLLAPTSGEVTLGGRRVDGPPPGMAFVFQEYGRSLFPWMRVGANVGLPLKRKKGLGAARRGGLVADALESVGLADAAGAYPWQLSGGMQQRVAIARALAYEPDVLLMDEPFAAVDAQTRADLEDLVRRLWQERSMTVLFVTHDIDEAVYLGERVIVLSRSPTVVQEQLEVDLPRERDQLTTRVAPRFAELRTRVYEQIQAAKRGVETAARDAAVDLRKDSPPVR